jgi:hypothetical protein
MNLKKISISNLARIFILNLIVCLFSLSYFGFTSPVALQKILSLKASEYHIPLYNKNYASISESELFNFLGSVPYSSDNLPYSWFVHPMQKYKDTIINGNGNCSNISFGAMYEFNNSKKQASIIHLLENDLSFLRGIGHTVLQINYEGSDAVIDVYSGGVPLQNKTFISASNFTLNPLDVFSQLSFNEYKNSVNDFFDNYYLSKITFGIVPQREIEGYFKFLENFYFPLGSVYLEKLFFDTSALFFGQYPNTYVEADFLYNTYNGAKLQTVLAYLTLITFHLSYITFILLILNMAYQIRKRKSN